MIRNGLIHYIVFYLQSTKLGLVLGVSASIRTLVWSLRLIWDSGCPCWQIYHPNWFGAVSLFKGISSRTGKSPIFSWVEPKSSKTPRGKSLKSVRRGSVGHQVWRRVSQGLLQLWFLVIYQPMFIQLKVKLLNSSPLFFLCSVWEVHSHSIMWGSSPRGGSSYPVLEVQVMVVDARVTGSLSSLHRCAFVFCPSAADVSLDWSNFKL